MIVEEEMKILEEINKAIIIKGELLYSYEIKEILDQFIVKEDEDPLVTKCRNLAIEKGLPLYFIYHEKTGIFEVYITETKELFERRHCYKPISNYEFNQIATEYLDDYSEYLEFIQKKGDSE